MTASRATAGRRTAARVPTLRQERALLRAGHTLVAGMDEVGRGALAGPVTVGVVVVHAGTPTAPSGVRDSKLLSPAARQDLAPRLRRWAHAYAVGHAQPSEIDQFGIIAALRMAGRRALAALPEPAACVLLDGAHDWLTQRPASTAAAPPPAPQDEVLFDLGAASPAAAVAPHVHLPADPTVVTMVKADLRCAAVAAASVLAKVTRDELMVTCARAHPDYGWHENKGYSAPEHLAALRRLGPCRLHRRSWSLPVGTPDEPLPGLAEPIPVGV